MLIFYVNFNIWTFIRYVKDLLLPYLSRVLGKVESEDSAKRKIHSTNSVVCKSAVCNSLLRRENHKQDCKFHSLRESFQSYIGRIAWSL